ncbi:MAG: restriction endonuclease [Pseudomonadota bacterium]
MTKQKIESKLSTILKKYQSNFSNKVYVDNYDSTDVLMDAFGVTQELKSENKQFWGRQLGMCWQLLVDELFKNTCQDYGTALKFERDEPCDLVAGTDAIDTKYRFGSGDSGTLKKLKQYGKLLADKGYTPVLLVVREDNLPAAMTACEAGGWTIYMGKQSFDYIQKQTHFDLFAWLVHHKNAGTFLINR